MEHPEPTADDTCAAEDSLAAVQAHYAEVAAAIAQQVPAATASSCPCCESVAGDAATQGEASNLYEAPITEGLPAAALAASRGCGDPVAKANLQSGETVLDLGSAGAGERRSAGCIPRTPPGRGRDNRHPTNATHCHVGEYPRGRTQGDERR